MLKQNRVKAMYVHIPFCERICSYCDFCKVLYDDKFVANYLTALKMELDGIYKDEVLDTLYIGGGTPSSLSVEEVEKLFEILSRVKLSSNYEYTFEANLESLTKEKIDLLKKYGVNRISIGVESTKKKFLKLLNRSLDKKLLVKTIGYLKDIGISNINLDLIYALDCQSLQDLEDDLSFFLSLDIPHISTYSLIIEKHTLLYINGVKEVDSDLDLKMYHLICKKLVENGYQHYEVSNFCKPFYYSKHNMTYWKNEEYYGIGLGSSGFLGNVRYTNTRSLKDYCAGKFVLEKQELDDYMNIENEIMLGLRTTVGIDKNNFFKRYHRKIEDIFDIDFLISKGVLLSDSNYLKVSADYFYVLNSVLVNILQSAKFK
ncbi:MAG: radical SAM family heme chaperone HemW [Bacilli bacterium]|nr:radical SAM family heme chaperone HemW [Bacilli bacterium]